MNLADFIENHREQQPSPNSTEFLRISSVSAKSEHKPDIERAARWVADKLRAAGFKIVGNRSTNLPSVVYAESLEAPGKPTNSFLRTLRRAARRAPRSLDLAGF